ncbi:MAG TPA: DUF2950 domain-containing protein [Phycisphaerae bacterium]|nr:DUF2950 domain-containing protein [Phycisphaerae bacterium]
MMMRTTTAAVLAAVLAGAAGCQSTQSAGDRNGSAAAQATAGGPSAPTDNRETFNSPEEALRALSSAVQNGDQAATRKLFGPEIDQVASSDAADRKAAMQRFAQAISQKAHVETSADGQSATVYIGPNDYPFAIPLAKDPSGKWFFDTTAGETEILNRRIGRDELDTIDLCHLLVQAEREYASADRTGQGIIQYAQRFMSTQGSHDGLYWPVQGWEQESPLGPIAAQAAAEGYPVKARAQRAEEKGPKAAKSSGPHPFHGYVFRILTKQGPSAPGGAYNYVINGHMVAGFAFLAYPAEYGKSGVMTFMISRNNVLYQKDLGADTAARAKAITSFDPGTGWTVVKEDQGAASQPGEQ